MTRRLAMRRLTTHRLAMRRRKGHAEVVDESRQWVEFGRWLAEQREEKACAGGKQRAGRR